VNESGVSVWRAFRFQLKRWTKRWESGSHCWGLVSLSRIPMWVVWGPFTYCHIWMLLLRDAMLRAFTFFMFIRLLFISFIFSYFFDAIIDQQKLFDLEFRLYLCGEQILSSQIHLMLHLSHPIHFYYALFIEIKNIEGCRSNWTPWESVSIYVSW
jgi:hypothetical protein